MLFIKDDLETDPVVDMIYSIDSDEPRYESISDGIEEPIAELFDIITNTFFIAIRNSFKV